MGGVNQLRYSGDIVHSPVVSESYVSDRSSSCRRAGITNVLTTRWVQWEIQSTGLAVGGTKVSKGVKVAIDTGTTQVRVVILSLLGWLN